MRKTIARSYLLVILLGAVAGLATLAVRDICFGFTLPADFGPELVAEGFLAIALPNVLVASLVLLAVFSMRGAMNRTFNGPMGGLLYAVAYCAAQYAFVRYAGDRYGLSPEGVLYSIPIIIACGIILGAAVGQRGYSQTRQRASESRKFVIVGIVFALLFHGIYTVLTVMSSGETTSVEFYAFVGCAALIAILALRAFIRHKRFDWAIQRR